MSCSINTLTSIHSFVWLLLAAAERTAPVLRAQRPKGANRLCHSSTYMLLLIAVISWTCNSVLLHSMMALA